MADLGRRDTKSVVVPNGTATSGAIQVEGYNAGAVQFPATFEPTTIKFQGAQGPGDTFVDIEDAAGAAVTNAGVTVSTASALPVQCFAFRFIKIVGTVGGNVAADRTLIIHLALN